MIRPADKETLFEIASSDPFFTRILSLCLCYGEGYDFVGLWVQELEGRATAAVSRFEDKFCLWADDTADIEELAAFLRFQGAGSVLHNAALDLGLGEAQSVIQGQVLEYTGDDYISDKEIYIPDLNELYDLLKTCESEIFRVPERLMFLSDLTHRRNVGRLSLTGTRVDGELASSVMTVSETDMAVILGAVATHPEHRGKGLSRSLVRSLASRFRREGRRVYVLSASDGNTRFYINSGFEITAGFKEIFLV